MMKAISTVFPLLAALLVLQLPGGSLATAGLAASPPMGFNNCNVRVALGLQNWTCCSGNQRLFEAMANAMKAKGLQKLGYRYINTDDGWMNHDRSQGVGKGTQVPQSEPWRFPDWQGMIDRLHDDGFLFGLYTAMGNQSCCKRATSCKNEVVDANQYAKWGVDYVKDDACSACPGSSAQNLQKMQDALDATGRKVMLSGEGGPPPGECSASGRCGNLRRVGHDITPYWSSVLSMIDLSYGLQPFAHNASGPSKAGFFNDMDVLEVGNGEFDCSTPESIERAKAHISMWSLMKSPLLLGTDLTFAANPHLEGTILGIVGHAGVIAINQDPLGVQARRVSSVPGLQVPASSLGDSDALLVMAACDASRPLQRWRHNRSRDVDAHGSGTGKGALWTVDSQGTRWCATSVSAGMWNVLKCDGVTDTQVCQGASGRDCIENITLCQPSGAGGGSYHHVCTARVDETKPGPQNMRLQEWQGLFAGYDNSEYGSGPVPHSRYMMIGNNELSFDPSRSTTGGSPVSPVAGSTIRDDDSTGHSREVEGTGFCLDIALGGNLEVWMAPMTRGRVAVGLFNRSPANATIVARWADLGLPPAAKFDATDVWSGASMGKGLQGSVSAQTAHHALTLLMLTPSASSASTPLVAAAVQDGGELVASQAA